MINSIDLIKLRNDEYIQFLTDFLGITLLNNPTAMLVKPQYDAVVVQQGILQSLFVTDQGSPLTAQIEGFDQRRDAALNGITALANAYLYHFDPVIKGHATYLTHHLGLYGTGIARENYQAETATITNIINDWNNKPELIAAITALGIGTWKAELQTANTSFNTLYLQRTQEMGAASPETILQKRVDANTAYYKLRDFIDSFFTINEGADPWGKCTNELNALITQYNTMLAARSSDNETPGEPPTEG